MQIININNDNDTLLLCQFPNDTFSINVDVTLQSPGCNFNGQILGQNHKFYITSTTNFVFSKVLMQNIDFVFTAKFIHMISQSIVNNCSFNSTHNMNIIAAYNTKFSNISYFSNVLNGSFIEVSHFNFFYNLTINSQTSFILDSLNDQFSMVSLRFNAMVNSINSAGLAVTMKDSSIDNVYASCNFSSLGNFNFNEVDFSCFSLDISYSSVTNAKTFVFFNNLSVQEKCNSTIGALAAKATYCNINNIDISLQGTLSYHSLGINESIKFGAIGKVQDCNISKVSNTMSFNINVLSGNGGSLYFGGLAGYIERSNIKDITLFVNFSIVTNGIYSYFGSLTAFCSESNLKQILSRLFCFATSNNNRPSEQSYGGLLGKSSKSSIITSQIFNIFNHTHKQLDSIRLAGLCGRGSISASYLYIDNQFSLILQSDNTGKLHHSRIGGIQSSVDGLSEQNHICVTNNMNLTTNHSDMMFGGFYGITNIREFALTRSTIYNSVIQISVHDSSSSLGNYVGDCSSSFTEINSFNNSMEIINSVDEKLNNYVGGLIGFQRSGNFNFIFSELTIKCFFCKQNEIGVLSGILSPSYNDIYQFLQVIANHMFVSLSDINSCGFFNSAGQQFVASSIFYQCGDMNNINESEIYCIDQSLLQSNLLITNGSLDNMYWKFDNTINNKYPFIINSFMLMFTNQKTRFIDNSSINSDSFYISSNLIFPLLQFNPCFGNCSGLFIDLYTASCNYDHSVQSNLVYCQTIDQICDVQGILLNGTCIGVDICSIENCNTGICGLNNYTLLCICDNSHMGPKCEFCSKDHFGIQCNITYEECRFGICNNQGECIENWEACSCYDNYAGFHCDMCKENFEGEKCENCVSQRIGSNCEYQQDMCDNDICGNRGTCVMYKQVLKCICDEMYFGLNCEKCENGQSVKNYCVQENMLNGAKISGIVFGCICVFVLIIVVVVVVRGKMNKPKKNDAKKQGDDEKGELVGDHSEEV